MFRWRITKYSPALRNGGGAYRGNDWTSVSDIGASFCGSILTVDDYLSVENQYVSTALEFLADAAIKSLAVIGLETKHKVPAGFYRSWFPRILLNPKVTEGERLRGERLEGLMRAMLRELMWCRLESKGRMYIHFGYDYYMYIGSRYHSEASIQYAREAGLFVEEMSSPYLEVRSRGAGGAGDSRGR